MTAAQNIPELFTGYKWPTTTITYTFIAEYAPYTPQAYQEPGGPTLLSEEQKAATRQLFADVQSFLGVQFVEVTQDNSQNQIGQIAIGMRSNLLLPTRLGETEANLNLPGEGGDIWLKAGSYGNGAATDAFLNTMLHEIGHALGLDHPTIGGVQNLPRYTVDSDLESDLGSLPTKLQLYDISALQYLYGAASSRNPGNSTYSYSGNQMESIWDTGGNDTITAAGRSASVIINLNQTAFSSIGFAANNLENPSNNISIAKGAVIENAIGGNVADLLIGNSTGNTLTGNGGDDFIFGDEVAARGFFPAGSSIEIRGIFWDTDFLYVGNYQTAGTDSTTDNDTIDAGAGADWVFAGKGADKVDGGAGNDFLDGGEQIDEMAYNGISGNVQLQKLAPEAVPDDIAANGQPVFQITVQRNGTSETDKIRGIETVSFGDGPQKFKGDFTLGDDSLLLDGGAGIDSFDFSSASTSITIYTGPVNGEENSVITGTGVSLKNFEAFVGSAQNDVFWFNEGDQLLYGRGGDDYLVGGAGSDVLDGGEGDDILLGGDGADKFIVGDGYDTYDTIMDADAGDRLFIRVPTIAGNGSGETVVPILGGFFENTPWDPGPHGTTIGDSDAIFKPRDVIWGEPDAPLYQSLGIDFKIDFWLDDTDLVIDISTQAGQDIAEVIIVGYEPGDLGLVFEEKLSPYQVDGVHSWFDEAEPGWEAAHKALLNNGVFGSIQQASDFIV